MVREGVQQDSRNGPVLVAPTPVTTVYTRPTERVLFWRDRAANPYFHLLESLWMLAGRNDVGWVSDILPSMADFSDDGETFHGAYGYRWRNHFIMYSDGHEIETFDQLSTITNLLLANPEDRRIVLSMWNPTIDLGEEGKDFPCNTHIYFRVNTMGELDMTVCNRSNDMVWGAYGANAVHMSMLQEYMASSIGRPVGMYYQVSNNFHAYLDTFERVKFLEDKCTEPGIGKRVWCPYEQHEVKPYPLMEGDVNNFNQELLMFMDNPTAIGFTEPFFRNVAIPVWQTCQALKDKSDPHRFDTARKLAMNCKAKDWEMAMLIDINRREENARGGKSKSPKKG